MLDGDVLQWEDATVAGVEIGGKQSAAGRMLKAAEVTQGQIAQLPPAQAWIQCSAFYSLDDNKLFWMDHFHARKAVTVLEVEQI